MYGYNILYGGDFNENDNFEEGELVMHGYKIRVSCKKGTILLIDFGFGFNRKMNAIKKPRCASLGVMLRKMSISKLGQYVRMVGKLFNIFKTISALRALGGNVKKNIHFRNGKYVHMVRKKSASSKRYRAARAWGDVEIFKTKFSRGDLDEKSDVQRVTSRAP